jgi:hypothetical protein
MFANTFKAAHCNCLIPAVILFLFALPAASQQRSDWRSGVDQLIQELDSLSLRSQKSFSLLKPYHRDKDIRETWFYTTRENKVVIFEIQYVVDSMEFQEIYYLDKGKLLCMEQYESPYKSVYADQLKWGETFFFDNNYLRQYIISGKKGQDRGRSYSEFQGLAQFQRRYAELQRHMGYTSR